MNVSWRCVDVKMKVWHIQVEDMERFWYLWVGEQAAARLYNLLVMLLKVYDYRAKSSHCVASMGTSNEN